MHNTPRMDAGIQAYCQNPKACNAAIRIHSVPYQMGLRWDPGGQLVQPAADCNNRTQQASARQAALASGQLAQQGTLPLIAAPGVCVGVRVR